ncbi:MAG: FoF1 ATP synthase subunit a [Anaerolineae bacterium]|nr:FoF1 ATP synthase subunit a [Anaerolineae bacterium]
MFGIGSITDTPGITLEAEKVFQILGFPVTNSMIASWLTMIILIVVSILAGRRMKLIPTGFQNVVETVLEMFYKSVAQARTGDKARIFFPFSATIFFFILLSNWLGAILPGFGSIFILGHHHGEEVYVPLLRSANTDLNTTLALALFSVFGTQIYGIRLQGFFRYVSRFVRVSGFVDFFKSLVGLRPRKGLLITLMNAVIDAFIGVLEIFDELTKLLSFSFRLFGNIFAGEVLLIVTAMLFFQIFRQLAIIPYPVTLIFVFLELFVGFIQAFIFATLTLVFLRMATTHH